MAKFKFAVGQVVTVDYNEFRHTDLPAHLITDTLTVDRADENWQGLPQYTIKDSYGDTWGLLESTLAAL